MIDPLDRIVRKEGIEQLFFGVDEVVIPTLREQLTPYLAAKVADMLRIDIRTPERQIISATLEAMRARDAQSAAELVTRLFDQYRAGGLAVVGLRQTLSTLNRGQVDALLLSASIEETRGEHADDTKPLTSAELVIRGRQTGADVTFIEDPASSRLDLRCICSSFSARVSRQGRHRCHLM